MSMIKLMLNRWSVSSRYLCVVFVLLGLGWSRVHDQAGVDPHSPMIAQSPLGLNHSSPETWLFIPIDGMTCADGSATGIGVNFANYSSGKLLVYLSAGGGCWSASTCKDSLHVQNANLNGFDATTLQQVMVSGATQYSPPLPKNHGAHGIWDRSSAANPFQDYNYVYIPYCTADFHAGNYPNSPMSGLSHVGYVNMTKALTYLAGVFSPSSTNEVVLMGGSAGGFGALWNFPQAQSIFGMIPVTLIAESGPPLPAPYLRPALEESWRIAWRLDETKHANATSTHLFPYAQWMAQAYPNNKLYFVAMTGDITLSLFLGISLIGPNSLSNGLFSIRQQLQGSADNVRFFLVPALVHGYIHQDPESWPSPSTPFGDKQMSLGNWMRSAVE